MAVFCIALGMTWLPAATLHGADLTLTATQELTRIMGSKDATALVPLVKKALNDPSPAARAAASLSLARGIELGDAAAAGKPEALNAAADYYRRSLSELSGIDRVVAHNNYAVLLVRLGQPQQALEPLRAIEAAAATLDPLDRASYLYTFGRALAAAGKPDEALRRYRDAVAADPGRADAVAAAEVVAPRVTDKAAAIADFAGVVDALQTGKRFDAAGDALAFAFDETDWSAHPDVAVLVTSLLRYFTEAGVPASTYGRLWQPRLKKVAEIGSSPVRERLSAVDRIYTAELEISFDIEQAGMYQEPYSAWRSLGLPDERPFDVFATFVRAVGDGFLQENNPRRAAERYSLAWLLTPDQGDAAVYLVSLLRGRHNEIDPEGRFLSSLVDRLLDEKLAYYRQGDMRNIARMHVTLGRIFDEMHQYGPASEFKSAAYHWGQALKWYQQLGYEDPVFDAAVPSIRARLTAALVGAGDQAAATELTMALAEFQTRGQRGPAKLFWSEALQWPGWARADAEGRSDIQTWLSSPQ